MTDETPAWLKAAQNGSIGEARTRAFLLDRFWVLERSVDVDGADMFIQRRLTNRNLFDRTPPRLGVVQVKFFASSATTQYIHAEYVKNLEGKPRPEFFVMCHTGDAEDARAFLMTAEDIASSFEVVAEGVHATEYRIGGAKLLDSNRYAVTHRTRSLDRIEHGLQAADFSANRSFMSWLLPGARLDIGAIEPIYREPIDNYWGDIPSAFMELKQTAKKAMYDLEDIYEKLRSVVDSRDPVLAFELIDDIARECRSPSGWHVRLPQGLWNPDFQNVALEHKEKVTKLRACGLLDPFLEFRQAVKEQFAAYLAPLMPLPSDRVHVVRIEYDPTTFTRVTVQSTVEDAKEYPHSLASRSSDGIVDAQPGLIHYWWTPGIFQKNEALLSAGWHAYVKEAFWSPYRDVMDALYATHFPTFD